MMHTKDSRASKAKLATWKRVSKRIETALKDPTEKEWLKEFHRYHTGSSLKI